MKIRSCTRPLVALLALAGTGLLGCSEDGPSQPEVGTADIDAYMESLPAWSEYSPLRESQVVQDSDPLEEIVDHEGTEYDCTTTDYSITETPDKIVTYNPDSEILWLGSLLQGDGYVGGIGSLQELPIRQRAPLTISIDLLTENNSRIVQNPNVATVYEAIGELIGAADAAGHTAGSDIFFEKEEAHSLRQSALSLGLSARYMGTSIESQLDWNEEVDTHTVTAYFIQNMFTTSMVLPQTPQSLFSDALTPDILQDQVDRGRIGPDNPPVYVSAISWGRIMTLTITSTRSVEELKAALTASYESAAGEGEGSVDSEHLEVLEESSIQVVTVGGDAENALALLRTGHLSEYFASDAALVTAKPISYTVRSLGDNSIAKVTETSSYSVQECSAVPQEPTGKRYKVTLEGIRMIDLGCDVWPDDAAAEVYYSFYVGDIGGLGGAVASRSASNTVEMTENEYVGLNATVKYCNVYYDGQRGKLRIKGDCYDWDGTSGNDHIASWDLNYYTPQSVPTGDWYSTRYGDCDVRLYVNVQEVGNLYD